jgi:hypothetical protein
MIGSGRVAYLWCYRPAFFPGSRTSIGESSVWTLQVSLRWPRMPIVHRTQQRFDNSELSMTGPRLLSTSLCML